MEKVRIAEMLFRATEKSTFGVAEEEKVGRTDFQRMQTNVPNSYNVMLEYFIFLHFDC